MRVFAASLGLALALFLSGCASWGPIQPPTVKNYPIGDAYASTEINATIFRLEALSSDQQNQYATFYNPAGQVVVAHRLLSDSQWTSTIEPFSGNVRDAHNDVVLGLSADHVLHLAYDHHNQPLHYRQSVDPSDLTQFGPTQQLTGLLETRVTYPSFLSGATGDLYFFYRDGKSGNGRLCLDYYNPLTHAWSTVQAPLLEGEGQSSPYWWRPEVGTDGAIHLAWCWRDTPDASTNHDICYAVSRDGGHTWSNSAGKVLTLPITRFADATVFPIAKGQNLINSCALAVDAHGHPHIVYYANGPDGVPQYFHLWFDGKQWSAQPVSQRKQTFSLAGQGTLKIPVSRPEIAVSRRGVAYLITRDEEFGGGLRLYASRPPYQQWLALDVLNEPLGEWEPSYDLARWRRDGVLSLFVLPVHQGNNEKTTDFPPQLARVVELSGLE